MKTNQHNTLLGFLSVGLVLLILGGLTWANYRFSKENPGGNDFLVHWVGTRAFLVDGISPYSDEVALRIQTMVYGRAAEEGEHQLRVAYPLYSTFIFAPFALVKDFTLARAIWMTVLELSMALTGILCIRITRWKIPISLLVVFFLFSFLWYHGVRPLINGNAVILVTLWVVIAFWAVQTKKDELAGLMIGLATIKPQLALLIGVYFAWYAISQRRWRILFWMVGSVAMLTLITSLMVPDWLIQNLREVLLYPSYNPPGTPGAAFAVYMPAVGKQVGWILTFILAVMLLLEWLGSLRREFRAFLWTGCLTLVVSAWSGIQTDPGNFILLILPLTLVFSIWCGRWKTTGVALTLVSMALVFFGIWGLFLVTVDPVYQPIQSPLMFFPLPAFLLAGLYWVRWWAIQPPSLWLDLLVETEEM